MTIVHSAGGLGPTTTSARRTSLFEICWLALQERRKRQRIRADLSDLSYRELLDIGISRGEIEYVVSNPSLDPRGL
ncbi:DUF1127 domain-containing protein [Bradyrhizobium lablabi]|uniref:DUF1127 domain-containing protein n=1 Tax=Bradyrhizobium lablabi TaxID=722472 RepID=UPI001BAE3998|nr:DUF1127 domain-containing protein [Bradyrhizobium lablabi]MBR0693526.1 DUF1127 domain-containing protein [Bradyrhizobium lablabi]